jgi:heptosyltransferase-2
MRLGVFLPNWVGDVVMATPAIRMLREFVGPEGQLVGIMRPYVAEVLAGTSWLDEQLLYNKTSNRLGFTSRAVIRDLRAARLDRIVLLTNSLRTAWLAWRSGTPVRIGFRNEGRAILLTTRVRQPRAPDGGWLPTVEGYAHLALAMGCESQSLQLELATTPADEQAADAVWQQLRLPGGDRVVVLNTGGAFGDSKQWPAEYFAELARRLALGDELAVLINCGPKEREVAREIAARAASPRVVSLADCELLPVGLTKACIRRSRLLVTTDSGPRFFGAAFGRPVVTLFGPTDPARTKLPYERETSLSLALECQPCMAQTCPLVHHKCMRDLTVDTVYNAVLRSLEASATDCAAC